MKEDYPLSWWEEHCHQKRIPDWTGLMEWIKNAKGKRTFKEFAELIGWNQVVFTRINKGRLKGPLKLRFLYEIAQHQEWDGPFEGDDELTKNDLVMIQLCQENGMDVEGYGYEFGENYDEITEWHNHLTEIRNIIILHLINKGYGVEPISKSELVKFEGCYRQILDCGGDYIHIKGVDPYLYRINIFSPKITDAIKTEFLSVPYHSWSCEGKVVNDDYIICRLAERVIELDAVYYLLDSINPECVNSIRILQVFTDRAVFDAFCNKIQLLKVNNPQIAILIDIEHKKVVGEKIIKGSGMDNTMSLFT